MTILVHPKPSLDLKKDAVGKIVEKDQKQERCFDVWPLGGDELTRPTTVRLQTPQPDVGSHPQPADSASASTTPQQYTIELPEARSPTLAWVISEIDCDYKDSTRKPRKPTLNTGGFFFRLYRETSYLWVKPASVLLSSMEMLTLRGNFPPFVPRKHILVHFVGTKANYTKEAHFINNNVIQVIAPVWPAGDKVNVQVDWCNGGYLLKGKGMMEFAENESLFGQIAELNEDHLDSGQNEELQADDEEGDDLMVKESHEVLHDMEHNEYVKARLGDTSKMASDSKLLQGIFLLIISSAFFGGLCNITQWHIPTSIGFLTGGIIVGPGGFDVIEELIQVETVAQLGIIFLLFELGMHFSLDKIKKAQRAAFGGGILLTFALVLINVTISAFGSTSLQEGVMIGIFSSLSSTALCANVAPEPNLIAVLITQDVLLALFLAFLPTFLGVTKKVEQTVTWSPEFINFCIVMIVLNLIAAVIFVVKGWRPTLTRNVVAQQTLVLSWCILCAFVSELLGVSMELGAFAGGFLLPMSKEHVEHTISPLSSFFGMLFFGSIGLVVHPFFLYDNTFAILSVAAWLLISKLFLGHACLMLMRVERRESMAMSLRLAHVGEFGFIFASKGMAWDILSRHVYLLLLGSTLLSLVSAPILFHLASQEEFNFLDIGLTRTSSRLTGGGDGGEEDRKDKSSDAASKEKGGRGGKVESKRKKKHGMKAKANLKGEEERSLSGSPRFRARGDKSLSPRSRARGAEEEGGVNVNETFDTYSSDEEQPSPFTTSPLHRTLKKKRGGYAQIIGVQGESSSMIDDPPDGMEADGGSENGTSKGDVTKKEENFRKNLFI